MGGQPLQPQQQQQPRQRQANGGTGSGCVGFASGKFPALAVGLTLACFVAMCSNAVLFAFWDDWKLHDQTGPTIRLVALHDGNGRGRSDGLGRSGIGSGATMGNAPSDSVVASKGTAARSTVSQTNRTNDPSSSNNNNKNKNKNDKLSGRNDNRNKLVYTCSYGPSGDAPRTTVTAPVRTPAFVVIGVQKSGSTAMLTYCRDHPRILQTKHKFRREGHFFDTNWNSMVVKEAERLGLKQANDKHCLALEQYMKLFETETILAHSQTLAHSPSGGDNDSKNNNNNNTISDSSLPLFTFEKTMSYVINPAIPARIKHTVPWAKVVLVLRNPVDRLYSQYKMLIRDVFSMRKYSLEDLVYHELKVMKGKWLMTNAPLPIPKHANGTAMDASNVDPSDPVNADHYDMPEIVPADHLVLEPERWKPSRTAILKKPDGGPFYAQNFVRRGLYAAQLEWWLEHYTVGEDLLVVDYADLLEDTRSVYERVLRFAEIPLPANPDSIDFDQKVRADDRRDYRPLSEDTRRYLAAFYAPSNARLEALLGPEWSADKLGWD